MENEDLDFYASEVNLDDVSVKDLDALGKEISDQRLKVEVMKAEQSAQQAILDQLQAKMVAYLSHFGKKSYQIPGVGTFGVQTKFAVTVPKDLEDKKKLLQWLRHKSPEFYLETVTVNYQTLNGVYNQEVEIAAQEGRDITGGVIPGISPPKETKVLRVTKGK